MQARALIMLIIAVILGGVAAWLVNARLQEGLGTAGTSETLVETRPVVVAKVNLDVGIRLDKVMLKTVQWPVDGVPEDAFLTVEEAVGAEPRVVLQTMVKNEIVLHHKLSEEGARGGLTPRIPPDMRAITISVNEIRGVAGFVLPGDRVDLLLTSTLQRKAKRLTTRTLMQNALVLGVAQEASQKKDDPKVVKSVTLLVTPRQAQKLILAQAIGTLTLVLRNEGDVGITRTEVITFEELSGESEMGLISPSKKVLVKKTRAYQSSGVKVDVIRGLSIRKESVKAER